GAQEKRAVTVRRSAGERRQEARPLVGLRESLAAILARAGRRDPRHRVEHRFGEPLLLREPELSLDLGIVPRRDAAAAEDERIEVLLLRDHPDLLRLARGLHPAVL